MEATPEEIEILYQVQDTDLDIKHMNKKLEELPRRKVILDARKKRTAIEAKRDQIEKLHREAKKKLTRINDEDASLEKKENGVQAAIEAAGNDYRNAEARTKELNGIFKRRTELAEHREAAEQEIAKIQALEEQVTSALHDLDAAENEATASFKSEGTALVQSIARAQALKERLVSGLSAEVALFFDHTSKMFDTVSLATLDGGSCSVCRAHIEPGRLLELRQEAPLAHCPHCRRILIIGE